MCVIELASMLAGEPFSDRPRCVSPVIGEFLRVYNDSVHDARRDDLYEFASLVVGTRSTAEAEKERARACLEWLRDHVTDPSAPDIRALARRPSTRRKRFRIAELAARHAAASRFRHEPALALLRELTGQPAEPLIDTTLPKSSEDIGRVASIAI